MAGAPSASTDVLLLVVEPGAHASACPKVCRYSRERPPSLLGKCPQRGLGPPPATQFRDDPQLAHVLLVQFPNFSFDLVAVTGQLRASKSHLPSKALADVSVGGCHKAFCEGMVADLAALAPQTDWSGIEADIAVGLSSSMKVHRAVILATAHDQQCESLALAVAMALRWQPWRGAKTHIGSHA